MAASDMASMSPTSKRRPLLAVVDQFGDAAYAGGDGGNAAGHGFERGEAEGLHLAGHEHEVGEGEELVDVVLLADEVDAVLDVELEGEVLGGAAVGAVADEHEARGHGARRRGRRLRRRPGCA